MHTEFSFKKVIMPIPVAMRSKAQICGRALSGSMGLNPTRGMDVCLLRMLVLSGRGLCNEPIRHPEESYRLWCLSECDQVKKNLNTYCD
jgi:hypothetical protein